jgi:hypothetical protein
MSFCWFQMPRIVSKTPPSGSMTLDHGIGTGETCLVSRLGCQNCADSVLETQITPLIFYLSLTASA